jgi:protein TonB
MPVYPPLALRSGIEGTVYLELFINKEGYVLKAVVVQEIPEGKGFGEAAVAAFIGKKCKPAESDGKPVAVHIRYPVRFTIN